MPENEKCLVTFNRALMIGCNYSVLVDENTGNFPGLPICEEHGEIDRHQLITAEKFIVSRVHAYCSLHRNFEAILGQGLSMMMIDSG